MYKVIQTGSKGNTVLYFNTILVDCGVSYSKIKPYEQALQIILLTHEHKDHINKKTIQRLQANRPALRIGCCSWMLPLLTGLDNIDVYKIGEIYNYGVFKLSPLKLYHDVPNCGYRIFKNDYKIIHCTDTAHLQGIKAKDYDLYAIEHNYDEEKANNAIKRAEQTGEFCHAKGSIESHLSVEQAWRFIQDNRKPQSEVLKLHMSREYF